MSDKPRRKVGDRHRTPDLFDCDEDRTTTVLQILRKQFSAPAKLNTSVLVDSHGRPL